MAGPTQNAISKMLGQTPDQIKGRVRRPPGGGAWINEAAEKIRFALRATWSKEEFQRALEERIWKELQGELPAEITPMSLRIAAGEYARVKDGANVGRRVCDTPPRDRKQMREMKKWTRAELGRFLKTGERPGHSPTPNALIPQVTGKNDAS